MAAPLPLLDYASTLTHSRSKVPKGLDAMAHRIRRIFRRQRIRFPELQLEAQHIHERMVELRRLTTVQLDESLAAMRRQARRHAAEGLSAEQRREAFALLGETARRRLGLTPYPEQILGALIMEQGALAEMATGEGKTLTIGITAAYLAWKGRPCHIVTANDYLVQRDAEWLETFYKECGLTVGTVIGPMKTEARKQGYGADITYVTSKEVVADFLRDRLILKSLLHPGRRLVRRMLQPHQDPSSVTVMRGLHTAIIDEADHVLIDEAVTPLIISRPVENLPLNQACQLATQIAAKLVPDRHFEILPRYRDVELKQAGKERIAEYRASLPNIWRSASRSEELVRQALVAQEFFLRGEQYVVTPENKIAIVDESTGRLMPERTWRQGLHQAVEAKEGLPITIPSETLSRLSFQRFFRLYGRLGGCTGTAQEAGGEFWHIYRLPVFRIPTHRPCIRQTLDPQVFVTAEAKREAIVAQVAAAHLSLQPVLLGTRTVAESERLSELLTEKGLHHHLLNASRHKEEAEIIAEAGRERAITIATNMAGRGTDIRLGIGAADHGGLLVIISELHGSSRIDRQLEGRSARQGEPGRVQRFTSLEDELAVRFLVAWSRRILKWLLEHKLPGAKSLTLWALRQAQKRAEAQTYRQRKEVPRQDEWVQESLAFGGTDESQ